MNIITFKKHLQKKQNETDKLYKEISPEIQNGKFSDSNSIWSNNKLVSGGKFEGRTAKVIFPESVNLLTSTVFYDRIYFRLDHRDYRNYNRINSEKTFKDYYQFTPNELLNLVELGRLVPILDLDWSYYDDYVLKNFLFALETKGLPYLSFAGHALICQIWQYKYQALPDPQEPGWGFLMDLASAMGIGANLIRPEFKDDIWNRHDAIFNVLGFDEVKKYFVGKEINLEDFFIATGISYDSSMPVFKYLNAFDQINKEKIFALYKSLDKATFYDEIQNLNDIIAKEAKKIDQEQITRKVLTTPIAFAFYLATETIKTLLGPIATAIEKMTEKDLEKILKPIKTKFKDEFSKKWHDTSSWLTQNQFPEALELAKLRHILKQDSRDK